MADRRRWHTETQLGPKQSLTPEGFLLCEDVPIARTGDLLYAPGEVPVEPGPDHIIRIKREADAVFSPITIGSFTAKAVTDNHPPGLLLGPDNWRQYAVGSAQNIRRGEGTQSDFLLADLLITDAAAIREVRAGKREVSCGYDADYEQIAPGLGRQTNIIGNHVALVERGRCGPRCAIGDQAMPVTTGPKRMSFMDKIRAAFKTGDEGELENALTEYDADAVGGEGGKDTHIHINMAPTGNPAGAPVDGIGGATETDGVPSTDTNELEEGDQQADVATVLAKLCARLDAIEAHVGLGEKAEAAADALEEATAPEGSEAAAEEDAGKTDPDDLTDEELEEELGSRTGDTASLLRAWQDARARAEILIPGMRLPTLDSAIRGGAKASVKSLCQFRRDVVVKALASDQARDAVVPFVGKRDVSKLTCDAIRGAFVGSSEIMKRANTPKPGQTSLPQTTGQVNPRSMSEQLRQINERNHKVWGG